MTALDRTGWIGLMVVVVVCGCWAWVEMRLASERHEKDGPWRK